MIGATQVNFLVADAEVRHPMVDPNLEARLEIVRAELDEFLEKHGERLSQLQSKRMVNGISDQEDLELFALEQEKRQIREEKLLLMKKQAHEETST